MPQFQCLRDYERLASVFKRQPMMSYVCASGVNVAEYRLTDFNCSNFEFEAAWQVGKKEEMPKTKRWAVNGMNYGAIGEQSSTRKPLMSRT